MGGELCVISDLILFPALVQLSWNWYAWCDSPFRTHCAISVFDDCLYGFVWNRRVVVDSTGTHSSN